ncbi:MAG TPA: hypothetical protein VMB81_30320 [Candidatus Sulfotelmatobacter sp.]|nr:hypothetical protein [Candidatus Sulfotelmatobacter sp.]
MRWSNRDTGLRVPSAGTAAATLELALIQRSTTRDAAAPDAPTRRPISIPHH